MELETTLEEYITQLETSTITTAIEQSYLDRLDMIIIALFLIAGILIGYIALKGLFSPWKST